MGIGIGIAMALGSVFSSMTLGVAAVIAGAINGALVGAAIGGLTAAFTGGDIGKGMLYGAVGGAITGGLMAWASEGFAVLDTGKAAADAGKALQVSEQVLGPGGEVIKTTMSKAPEKFMGMSGDMLKAAGSTMSGAAQGLLGKPEGIDIDAQTAAQLEINQQQIDAQSREAELARGGRMQELETQLASTDANTTAQLAEQRRQYDVTGAIAAARKEEAGQTMGMLTIGEEDELGSPLYTNVAGVA